jgi:hypothetical protein
MLLNVIFDKTLFEKFNNSSNFKQNIDETLSKQLKSIKNPYQPMDVKNLTKKILEPKVSRLLPNVYDFREENHTLGCGFKNLKKIYSLAYGF